jgi:hypothetical protein
METARPFLLTYISHLVQATLNIDVEVYFVPLVTPLRVCADVCVKTTHL